MQRNYYYDDCFREDDVVDVDAVGYDCFDVDDDQLLMMMMFVGGDYYDQDVVVDGVDADDDDDVLSEVDDEEVPETMCLYVRNWRLSVDKWKGRLIG